MTADTWAAEQAPRTFLQAPTSLDQRVCVARRRLPQGCKLPGSEPALPRRRHRGCCQSGGRVAGGGDDGDGAAELPREAAPEAGHDPRGALLAQEEAC